MVAPILSAGTHVIVGDGRKAIILFNEGTAEHPSLTVETFFTHPDLPTRNLGAERPSRVYASVGMSRSSTDETDWHQKADDQFVHDVMAGLVELAKREKLKKLVLVAPPRTMGKLRKALPTSFAHLVVAEITKDLTGHTVPAITALLQAENKGP